MIRHAKTSWLIVIIGNVLNDLSCISFSISASTKPPIKAKWINLLKSNTSLQKITPPRSGHVSFTTKSEKSNNVYTFGGYVEEEAINRYASNDLWTLSSNGWVEIDQYGDVPNVRLASACAAMNNKAFLFGGWDPQKVGTGGVILDSIHEFDMDANNWTYKCDFPDGPTSRHVAISLPHKQQILIHNHRCIDHVLLYDIKDNKVIKQAISGDVPSSRGLHVACLLDDQTIVLFGGAAQNGQMSNEVFILNIDTWAWDKIDLASDCSPAPRASPCMCVVNEDTLILYGGAEYVSNNDGSNMLYGHADTWSLCINKQNKSAQWELLIPEDENNEIPPGRNAATLSQTSKETILEMIQDDVDNEFDDDAFYYILHGGWKPFQKTFNDMFVLKVTKG